MLTMRNIDTIYNRLITCGTEWAEADEKASFLEETRKTVLAQLMMKSTLTSSAAKETEAMANPEYSNHLKGMCEARLDANKKKVLYEASKTKADFIRSLESTERAANRNAV